MVRRTTLRKRKGGGRREIMREGDKADEKTMKGKGTRHKKREKVP